MRRAALVLLLAAACQEKIPPYIVPDFQHGAGQGGAGGAAGDHFFRVSDRQDLAVGSDATLPLGAAARTVEAWVRTGSDPTGSKYAVVYGRNPGFLLGVAQDRAAVVHASDFVVGRAVGDSTWHHLAATLDEGGTLALYVDGQRETGRAVAVDTRSGGADGLTLGGVFSPSLGVEGQLAGDLDEVRVWSRALTGDELELGRRMTLGGQEPGLLAYYGMDQAGSGKDVRIRNRVANASVLDLTTRGTATTPTFEAGGPLTDGVGGAGGGGAGGGGAGGGGAGGGAGGGGAGGISGQCSISSGAQVFLRITNRSSLVSYDVKWVDFMCMERAQGTSSPGASDIIQTFPTHVFRIYENDANHRFVLEVVMGTANRDVNLPP